MLRALGQQNAIIRRERYSHETGLTTIKLLDTWKRAKAQPPYKLRLAI
jgi:hypothetical protein